MRASQHGNLDICNEKTRDLFVDSWADHSLSH